MMANAKDSQTQTALPNRDCQSQSSWTVIDEKLNDFNRGAILGCLSTCDVERWQDCWEVHSRYTLE